MARLDPLRQAIARSPTENQTARPVLVTLPNLTAKKSTKMKISANKIHVFCNFSLGNPKGPKIWNALPKNVISITSLSRFKKRTYDFFTKTELV